MKGLTSLTQLSITYCKMLKCLPEELQQLTNLSIKNCPTLAKRCEKGIGQDWYKIAHIPHLLITNDEM